MASSKRAKRERRRRRCGEGTEGDTGNEQHVAIEEPQPPEDPTSTPVLLVETTPKLAREFRVPDFSLVVRIALGAVGALAGRVKVFFIRVATEVNRLVVGWFDRVTLGDLKPRIEEYGGLVRDWEELKTDKIMAIQRERDVLYEEMTDTSDLTRFNDLKAAYDQLGHMIDSHKNSSRN